MHKYQNRRSFDKVIAKKIEQCSVLPHVLLTGLSGEAAKASAERDDWTQTRTFIRIAAQTVGPINSDSDFLFHCLSVLIQSGVTLEALSTVHDLRMHSQLFKHYSVLTLFFLSSGSSVSNDCKRLVAGSYQTPNASFYTKFLQCSGQRTLKS